MPDRPPDDPTSLAGRLYDSYGGSLYRYALMLLADAAAAEDAVQQVFASLLRGSVSTIEKDVHYLRRAVRNECYSMLRRRDHSVRLPPSLKASADRRSLGGGGQPDDRAARLLDPKAGADSKPEERLAVEHAIRGLSPDQREVVHLHVYEGLTFQEIADASGESINTCREPVAMPSRN